MTHTRITGFLFLALGLAARSLAQEPSAVDPQVRDGKLTWFLLTETREQVRRVLGPPRVAAPFANDYEAWQYQIDNADGHEFSHLLVFRKSTGSLISITRNYEPERAVDEFFPTAQTTTHDYPDAEKPQFSVRLRRLPGGRVLAAVGVSKQSGKTGQIVLIREAELRFFFPWLVKSHNTD